MNDFKPTVNIINLKRKSLYQLFLFMITIIGYKAIHFFLHGFLVQNLLHEIFRAP